MQETPTISSDAASVGTADRRLLIDGRLLETERTFPSINPATGHNRRLHAQSSVIKNRPSDYENRTLGVCVLARHQRSLVRTGETFVSYLSQR